MQEDIKRIIALKKHIDLRLYLLAAGSLLGMLLSFVNVFLKREKTSLEKWCMLIFAVSVTVGTGIYGGYLMFASSVGWMLVFPAWNITNAVILLVLCRIGFVTTECVTDEAANFFGIAASIIAVTILLGLCQYIFKLHWVYTYSIAICYTMSLQGVLQDFFPKAMKN